MRGRRVSAIAFMSVCGVLDLKIVEGTVDSDTYCDFVEKVKFTPSLNAIRWH